MNRVLSIFNLIDHCLYHRVSLCCFISKVGQYNCSKTFGFLINGFYNVHSNPIVVFLRNICFLWLISGDLIHRVKPPAAQIEIFQKTLLKQKEFVFSTFQGNLDSDRKRKIISHEFQGKFEKKSPKSNAKKKIYVSFILIN